MAAIPYQRSGAPPPEGELDRPRIEQPARERGGGGVGGASHDREMGADSEVGGGRSGEHTADLNGLANWSQKIDSEVELVDDILGPVVGRQVVEQRGGGVARLGRRLVDKAQPQP